MAYPNYTRKNYLDKILPFVDKPVVKVITGIRRSGKSFLLKQLVAKLLEKGIASEKILYVNKELVKFDFIKNYRDLHHFVTEKFEGVEGQKYLFVDEVQEIEDWEKAISSFLAEGDYDIFITGSNANLLSSEIATLLSGRYVEISMFPLSFTEFCEFRATNFTDFKSEFQLYLKYGGFPVIHFFDYSEELIFQYVNSLYNTILLKDVISRYQIRNIHLFENLVKYVFSNIGNVFSGRSISKYLKSQQLSVGLDTIQNYLQYLENSMLVHKVKRYDIRGKRVLEMYEKYYLADLALKNGITGFKEQDIAGMLENIVFLRLKQLGYTVFIGKYNDYEIDFIAENKMGKVYIQVTYLINSEETREREFRGLLEIKDNYPKYVLSMDELPETNTEGIVRRHIVDFLRDFK